MASAADSAPVAFPEPPELAELLKRDPYLEPYREHIAARFVYAFYPCGNSFEQIRVF